MTGDDGVKLDTWLRMGHAYTQHLLLHPFVALRRTCQMNRKCSPIICVQPFSLLPFMYHQQRNTGLTGLYRGLSSELLVKGIMMGSEAAIAHHMEWPTEISTKRYAEDSIKILTLKALGVAIATPFLCSSVIETVQSVIVVKDGFSFVDCVKDGLLRVLHLRSTPSARMLPIWLLVAPTVFYYVSHSIVFEAAKGMINVLKINLMPTCSRSTKRRYNTTRRRAYPAATNNYSVNHATDLNSSTDLDTTTSPIDSLDTEATKISNMILASLVADIILLPIETVLNCLYVQGTRTIIDNCDETTVVLPVLTNYDGFTDCYQSILRFEGNLGLYKGLGAIILQYTVHFVVFRSIYYLFKRTVNSRDDGELLGSLHAL